MQRRQQQQQQQQDEINGGGGGDDLHPAGRRCAACRYLRRRCAQDCVLAPFFPASSPHRYACVHRVFGASNITRLLQSVPMAERGDAANTMAMEAYWRVQDPVYGCTGIINRLQDEIRAVQCELAWTQAQVAIAVGSSAAGAPPPPQPPPPPLPPRQSPRRPLPPPQQYSPPRPLLPPPVPQQLASAGGHAVTIAVLGQESPPPSPPMLDPADEFLNLDGF